MDDLTLNLRARLEELDRTDLRRRLRRVDGPQGRWVEIEGARFLNFSSNDYLGLANDPRLRTAASEAALRYGVGSGASRLICGSMAPHHALEEALAAFKGTEAALVFGSGYLAALGTIQALVGRGDVLILDKLVHACVVDAARLSGAKLRVFAHNDPADLERILRWADARREPGGNGGGGRILIVTESVFSMDGDLAPLRDLVLLKEKYGAWLMVDEAHATGLFGERKRGLAEAFEVEDRVDIQMGTLGKALGVSGGYICGTRVLIDYLINRARSFVYSTAPSPMIAAAASEALRLVQSPEGEQWRTRLWGNLDALKNEMVREVTPLPPVRSPIVPLLIGDEGGAMDLAEALRSQGIFLPGIRYPSVPRGKARLRLTMTAAHEREDLDLLVRTLAALQPRFMTAS